MAREFSISRDVTIQGTPEQVWDAITNGTGGWLWPMEYEPRLGGAAAFGGTVTAWDPPHHFATRVEGENGWYNNLDHVIEAREGGQAVLHYVHSGVLTDDWDNQYDGASKHTDFYLATLGQYVRWFSGRPVTYASVEGPDESKSADAFQVVRQSLGIADDASVGDRIQLTVRGADPIDAEVDYLTEHFIGLRTDDALYRFFGRNAFGAPVAVAVHHFGADADQKQLTATWQNWLDTRYV